MLRPCLVANVVLITACNDQLPPPDGPHHRYVVSDLAIPVTNTEARANGLDLNGDGYVDNQLGMVFSTLAREGLGVGATASEALLRGGILMLADMQTSSFEATESTGVTMFLGRDPVPAPCVDPALLETCGQHLLGTGEFTVEGGSESDVAVAPIIDGTFEAGLDRLAVQIAIDPTAPIRLDLHAARVKWTAIEPGRATAILAGGITKADVANIIIPEAAAQMDRIVSTECVPPPDGSSCGCLPDSRAKLLQGLFDTNHDCRVDTTEVATSSIVVSLTAPDVTVRGEQLLSFGAGVELAHASFDVADE